MKFASAAASRCKKAVKLGFSLFGTSFNSSKCKTMAKMAVARIKLLRNKREVVVRQMRRDIAMLLESGQDTTARVRVEHVIRERNIMAANEFIELFCELIVARLPIIAKQRDCPADLKEGISSLIFAAPRCSDIPELLELRDIFEKKFGKDFVSAATDLRPNSGVNRMLIEKLSVRTPPGEVKLKVMKEIGKEYQVEWDTKESEMELLKPPEGQIEGPNTFVSASSLPVKPIAKPSLEPNNLTPRCSDNGQTNAMHFKDTASAAEAAADSAKKAIAAAEAAAYLASKDSYHITQAFNSNNSTNASTVAPDFGNISGKLEQYDLLLKTHDPSNPPKRMVRNNLESSHNLNGEVTYTNDQKICRRHSYNVPAGHSDTMFDEELEVEKPTSATKLQPDQNYRRHSYIVATGNSGIKFDDESDCDEEIEMEEPTRGNNLPPNRPAPQVPPIIVKQDPVPRVHPKLPDYDTLAARFEALKHHKSQK